MLCLRIAPKGPEWPEAMRQQPGDEYGRCIYFSRAGQPGRRHGQRTGRCFPGSATRIRGGR
ncbi:protein of unknown function [Aminobacter niigataensis]|nr:protein of unknown function [Aminobacter niigataensis]